MICLFVSLHHI